MLFRGQRGGEIIMAEIVKAAAVYTGGSIYIVFGDLSDGTYFYSTTDDDWVCLFDSPPYAYDNDGNFVAENSAWYDAHIINGTISWKSVFDYLGDENHITDFECANYMPSDFADK